MKKLSSVLFLFLFLVLIVISTSMVNAEEGNWEWYSGNLDVVSEEKPLCLLSADFTINGNGRNCKGYFLELPKGVLGEPKLLFKYELDNECFLINSFATLQAVFSFQDPCGVFLYCNNLGIREFLFAKSESFLEFYANTHLAMSG